MHVNHRRRRRCFAVSVACCTRSSNDDTELGRRGFDVVSDVSVAAGAPAGCGDGGGGGTENRALAAACNAALFVVSRRESAGVSYGASDSVSDSEPTSVECGGVCASRRSTMVASGGSSSTSWAGHATGSIVDDWGAIISASASATPLAAVSTAA
jgi:hypothetical protein